MIKLHVILLSATLQPASHLILKDGNSILDGAGFINASFSLRKSWNSESDVSSETEPPSKTKLYTSSTSMTLPNGFFRSR
jgi:hypothetical protein